MKKILEWLILLGGVLLIYYTKITQEGSLSLQSLTVRSDFVFLLFIFLASIYFLIRLLMNKPIYMSSIEQKVVYTLGLFVFFGLIATYCSYQSLGLKFNLIGYANFSKIIMGIILTLYISILLRNNSSLYKSLVYVLIIPPIIPTLLGVVYFVAPSLFMATFGCIDFIQQQFILFTLGDRFSGLTSNPFQLMFSNLIAISFLWVLALYYFYKKKYIYSILNIMLILFLIIGVILSAVRSAIIFILFIFIAGTIFVHFKSKVKGATVIIIFVFLGLSSVLTFVALPQRMISPISTRLTATGSVGEEDRVFLWRHYFHVGMEHPLGIGFNYEQKFAFPSPHIERQDYPPHNFFLTVWMYSGIQGIACIIVFLFFIISFLIKRFMSIKFNIIAIYYLGALISFCGIYLVSFFLGVPFGDFSHAIIMAMVLANLSEFYDKNALDRIPKTKKLSRIKLKFQLQ